MSSFYDEMDDLFMDIAQQYNNLLSVLAVSIEDSTIMWGKKIIIAILMIQKLFLIFESEK